MARLRSAVSGFCVWAVSIFLGLACSGLAWLIPLLDIPPVHFLYGCGVVAIIMAVAMQCGEMRELHACK